MRLGYVVDVHGAYERVRDVVADLGEIALLIVGGDITTNGTPDEVERRLGEWRRLAPELRALAGNMDSPAIDDRLAELGVALDGRGVRLGNIGVFGVSAAPVSPLHTPYELEEDELARRIERGFAEVAGCRAIVFCPHAPPRGTSCDRLPSGEHVGSQAVRDFVERAQPDVVLCGHIHEARSQDRIGRSQIVNPGPVAHGHYAIVDIDGQAAVTLDT
jgi:Icc-related predicted phosphoesterase